MYILSAFLIGVSAGMLFQRLIIGLIIKKYPSNIEDYREYYKPMYKPIKENKPSTHSKVDAPKHTDMIPEPNYKIPDPPPPRVHMQEVGTPQNGCSTI